MRTPKVRRFFINAALHERMSVVKDANASAVRRSFFNFESDVVAIVSKLLHNYMIVLLEEVTFFLVNC